MALKEEFEGSGNWLFRHRSYLPLVLLGLMAVAILHAGRGDVPPDWRETWEVGCLAVSLAGLLIRALVIGYAPRGTSGRNVGGQVADALATTGMYSLVRHPLYLGNLLMWLGIALVGGVCWVAVVTVLAFWLYYERIMFAEEEYLRRKFGGVFEEWAARTPAILPRLKGWRPPALPFSFRTALQREYAGLFALALCFAFVDVTEDFATSGRLALDGMDRVLLVTTATIYIVVRILRKQTRLLRVEGR